MFGLQWKVFFMRAFVGLIDPDARNGKRLSGSKFFLFSHFFCNFLFYWKLIIHIFLLKMLDWLFFVVWYILLLEPEQVDFYEFIFKVEPSAGEDGTPSRIFRKQNIFLTSCFKVFMRHFLNYYPWWYIANFDIILVSFTFYLAGLWRCSQ